MQDQSRAFMLIFYMLLQCNRLEIKEC